jgi:DNA-binding NtrC family response regulator
MTPKRDPATDAFRLDAVDYLLKPLDPDQVTEAVNRLLAYLRPFPEFRRSCQWALNWRGQPAGAGKGYRP